MLKIHVDGGTYYDDEKEVFFTLPPETIRLEHSLVSLSKWEMRWKKPFLSSDERTDEEAMSYIECMDLDERDDLSVYSRVTQSDVDAITEYISETMTATWFGETPGAPSREIITSEVVYYWMITAGIPFECQYWHLDRLLTLIKVCGDKSQSEKKKMSPKDLAQRNRSLNEARRREHQTTG